MNATLFLKDPLSKKKSLIFIAIYYNYKRYKFSTGESIECQHWNDNKQEANKSCPYQSELNTRLKKKSYALVEAIQQLINEGCGVDKEKLKQRFEELVNPGNNKPTEAKKFFIDYVTDCINNSVSGTRLFNGQKVRPGTIKGYKSTLFHLKNYEQYTKQRFEIMEIDRVFYNSFLNYLTGIEQAINSIGKHIKNVKVFANYASECGVAIHMDIRSRVFKTIAEDTDQVYLSCAELEKLYALQLDHDSRLGNVRDLFLIACYTGFRFGDLKALKMSNINSDDQITLTLGKTGKKVVIPLNWVIKEILEKNNYQLPRAISNQRLNEYLKELCQLAGLNEKVSVSKTKAGMKVEQIKEKWELISVHTARRSFATNLYLSNMDTHSIMMMTGHKTEKSFLRYIRVTELENARRAANHSFFSTIKPQLNP